MRRADLVVCAEAVVLLPIVAVAVRRWGVQRVQGALLARSHRQVTAVGAAALAAARRWARAVDFAATHGPRRANCLERSLVLWWILRRRGVAADLIIGVRRRPHSAPGARQLDFHAWIEHHGDVVNDVPDVRQRFATFGRPIAPPDAEWRRGPLRS